MGQVRQARQHAVDASHHGHPIVIEIEKTGGRGRPKIAIDPTFLRFVYGHRGATKIGRLLGCSRSTVQRALLNNRIAAPGHRPFALPPGPSEPQEIMEETDDSDNSSNHASDDDEVDVTNVQAGVPDPLQAEHSFPIPHSLRENTPPPLPRLRYGTTSTWSDQELDDAVRQLRILFPKAGITMMCGYLASLGQKVPQNRVGDSLRRVDPIQRVFGRIKIARRKYNVPGPNSLWHHDGQHGLICWGIVIHGFIDGYSRLITGLKASNNNHASTVLDLFLKASSQYGVPSRLRGDHGVENVQVAAFMELHRGSHRGSYIWGRSVHNVRIERLWVDVTTQFRSKWADFFQDLEVQHDLDINNSHHIWLLQYLFLADINRDATQFADGWNRHKMQIRDAAPRCPADMFVFDMLIHGTRGDQLSNQDLEAFGVDWEAMREARFLSSNIVNNTREGTSSWIGHSGPPPDLSGVVLNSPAAALSLEDSQFLYQYLGTLWSRFDQHSLALRWRYALAFCQSRSAGF
ncbi:hypothetical protein FRC02_002558 [Tulasnella sp. 418]|nr:hypothetical protein FRC02_002558 [Tulasnella sp. 418]